MDLIRTSEKEVSHLALWRAARGVTHEHLAIQVQVEPVSILEMEREGVVPAGPLSKRLGLALRIPHGTLQQEPLEAEVAWRELCRIRKGQRQSH